MQKDFANFYGDQIYDLQGELVGMLLDCVFEAETGKVLGYQVLARGGQKRYLVPQDVQTWIGNRLIVRDEDALEDLENLYRVQEGILLLKTPVVNQKNENLGEVVNYFIETRFGILMGVEVARKFLWIFRKDARIFPMKKIRKLGGEEIVVEDDARSLALSLATEK